MINPECKRCGLLKSTVDANDNKCIPDKRMSTTLEGVHDFEKTDGISIKINVAPETLAQLIIRDIMVESCGEIDLSKYEGIIEESIKYWSARYLR